MGYTSLRLSESATLTVQASGATRLTETSAVTAVMERASGRMRVQAISAGWGSSGYYSPQVLQEAANGQLLAEGTPMYLDHASRSENSDRPERSVRDIAGVFTTAATYDQETQALVAEVQVYTPYRELLAEMAPYVGLSITGVATDVTEGEAEGRAGRIIEGLASIDSVDWVTRAGRGGRVLSLLESARVCAGAPARAVARGVAEATANDVRDALSNLVRGAYSSDTETYVWLRDFDEATAWFELSGPQHQALYAQAYTATSDGTPQTLSGERTEVRAVTTYVPVNPTAATDQVAAEGEPPRPAGLHESTPSPTKETIVAKIEIEEAEHSALLEKAGRADALASKLAHITNTDQARTILTAEAAKARVEFNTLEAAGLLAALPLTAETGKGTPAELDVEAFTARVLEAVKTRVEAQTATPPTGRVTGFGSGHTLEAGQAGEATAPVTEAHTTPWGRKIEKGA